MQNSTRFYGGFFNLEMLEIFTTAFKTIKKYFPGKMERKKEKKTKRKKNHHQKDNKWLT